MSVRIVQGLILAGFLCELTLRVVAQRRRFFRGACNILDLIVVVTSVRTQHVLALGGVFMRARTHHTHTHTHTHTQVGIYGLLLWLERAGSGVSSRETDELSGGKTATTSVRVASRIAMGLHLLPVLVNALVHILAHVCRYIHTLARSLARTRRTQAAASTGKPTQGPAL